MTRIFLPLEYSNSYKYDAKLLNMTKKMNFGKTIVIVVLNGVMLTHWKACGEVEVGNISWH